MKNNNLLLVLIAFLYSCNNNLYENEDISFLTSKKDTIIINDRSTSNIFNKDSITTMNYNLYTMRMDTIFYPAVSFSIERIIDGKMIINVPRLDKEYIYNNGKYPDLPKENVRINTGCFLQYRLRNTSYRQNPWYYYSPDSIFATTPYYVEVPCYHPDDYRQLQIYLNPASFPRDAFDLRGRLYGILYIDTKPVKTMTEWYPSNGSYNTYSLNYNGFIVNNENNGDNRAQVEVVAEMILNINIHLYSNHSGIYEIKYGNQIKYLKYTNGLNDLSCSLSERRTVKAFLNSTFTLTMSYDGKDYNFNFYVLPGYRGGVLTSTNNVYINANFS